MEISILKDIKLELGSEPGRVGIAFGFQQRLCLFCDIARVEREASMRMRLEDVTEDGNSRHFGERVHECTRQVRMEEHVAPLDRREPGNAGTIEGHSLNQ